MPLNTQEYSELRALGSLPELRKVGHFPELGGETVSSLERVSGWFLVNVTALCVELLFHSHPISQLTETLRPLGVFISL